MSSEKKSRDYFKILWTINGVVVLTALLVFAATFLFDILGRYLNPYQGGVEIIDTEYSGDNQENLEELIKKEELYYALYGNTAIMKVISDAVSAADMSSAGDFSFKYVSESTGNMVNLKFIDLNSKTSFMLFDSDRYIRDAVLAAFNDRYEFNLTRNLYLVVERDTNENNRLDYEDSMTLYVSSPEGNNLVRVADEISNYNLIDEQKIYLKLTDGNYLILDYVTGNVLFSSVK